MGALPPPPPPHHPPRAALRVHARLHPDTTLSPTDVASLVTHWLGETTLTYADALLPLEGAPAAVAAAVDRVAIVDTATDGAAVQGEVLLFWQVRVGGCERQTRQSISG